MTRPTPRAHFNSSKLVRFLTENALLDAARAEVDVGQRLGDWLNFRQAITLHGVLHPECPVAPAPHMRRAPTMSGEALTRHVDKVRAQLEQSIAQGAPSGSGLARIDMPPAEIDVSLEAKTAFEPYRRFYAAHQRQMDVSLQTLRSQVRGQLQKSAPNLQQLAVLDAAFENILSEREAVLLSQVSKLLEKRFVQALKQHLKNQTEADAEGSDETLTTSVSAWLLPWRQALRSALLAELDTRMQPVLGLVEAFNQNTPQEQ